MQPWQLVRAASEAQGVTSPDEDWALTEGGGVSDRERGFVSCRKVDNSETPGGD